MKAIQHCFLTILNTQPQYPKEAAGEPEPRPFCQWQRQKT